jgi:hypothetical protein
MEVPAGIWSKLAIFGLINWLVTKIARIFIYAGNE